MGREEVEEKSPYKKAIHSLHFEKSSPIPGRTRSGRSSSERRNRHGYCIVKTRYTLSTSDRIYAFIKSSFPFKWAGGSICLAERLFICVCVFVCFSRHICLDARCLCEHRHHNKRSQYRSSVQVLNKCQCDVRLRRARASNNSVFE